MSVEGRLLGKNQSQWGDVDESNRVSRTDGNGTRENIVAVSP